MKSVVLNSWPTLKPIFSRLFAAIYIGVVILSVYNTFESYSEYLPFKKNVEDAEETLHKTDMKLFKTMTMPTSYHPDHRRDYKFKERQEEIARPHYDKFKHNRNNLLMIIILTPIVWSVSGWILYGHRGNFFIWLKRVLFP